MSEINWQKSSYSNQADGGSCVEVALRGDRIRIRESDEPDTVVTTSPAHLAALLRRLRTDG